MILIGSMKTVLITLVFATAFLMTNGQQKHKGDTTIYNSVEVQPEFPGGETTFAKFLATNIRYPATADKCPDGNIVGKIIIRFVVEQDGSLSNIKCEKPSCPEFDAEVKRIMKLSPDWTPGKIHNKPVRVSYTIPIYIHPQVED